jgi:hypothetical protein
VIVATTPALLAQLVDSATTDVDDGTRLNEMVGEHRRHRAAWYGGVLGLLVIRASTATMLARLGAVAGLGLSVVSDTGLPRASEAIAALRDGGAEVRRVEVAVAKRGEDPVPGVRALIAAAEQLPEVALHAEIPLTSGLLDALDMIASSGDQAGRLGVTFRVGGLAGELFPPPPTLASVICACRDRGLRFTVSAGLRRAMRHSDHETGFAHHGVLNLLTACLTAAAGAGPAAVAERLASHDPVPLVEAVRAARDAPRPLWTAFTSGGVTDSVADLELFELLSRDSTGSDNPYDGGAAPG